MCLYCEYKILKYQNKLNFIYSELENVTYEIRSAGMHDSGEYVCAIENKFGSNVHSGQVDVKHLLMTQPPNILIPTIKKLNVFEDSDITLKCQCSKQCETFDVHWFYENDQNKMKLENSIDAVIESRRIDYSLKLKSISTNDSGQYTCKMENARGSKEFTIQLNVKKPFDMSQNHSKFRCTNNRGVNLVSMKSTLQIESKIYDCKSIDSLGKNVMVVLLGKLEFSLINQFHSKANRIIAAHKLLLNVKLHQQ